MTPFKIDKIHSTLFSIPVYNPTLENFLSMFTIDFQKKDGSINIVADSVVFLNDFLLQFQDNILTYDYAYGFSHNIVKQLLYLEKQNQTIHAFSLDDFIVINNSFLIFVDFSKSVPIQDDKNIVIHSPYLKNKNTFFITTPMKNNTSLPLTIHYKNGYLSLAYLIIYLLYGKYYYDQKDNMDLIDNLMGTKLFYFLRNCLNEMPENRHICFF
jgi:hypothetical protein